jgi:uncharacterized protein (TIGR02452 family)
MLTQIIANGKDVGLMVDRKALANETLRIIHDGVYTAGGKTVDIAAMVSRSRTGSNYLSAASAQRTAEKLLPKGNAPQTKLHNESTLAAILRLGHAEGTKLAALNFASAKNPGGGFLNGANAQEESLAVAGSLYDAQLACPEYYRVNRATTSMMYTDSAIWSPDVVFFRDDSGRLLPMPVCVSVLTLPAVNYGQVVRKNENQAQAKEIMRRRMKIALALFAENGSDTIILHTLTPLPAGRTPLRFSNLLRSANLDS